MCIRDRPYSGWWTCRTGNRDDPPGAEMVELGNNLTEDARWLMGFVADAGSAVVASNSGTGYPESAYVHVAGTEAGHLVLGTNVACLLYTSRCV